MSIGKVLKPSESFLTEAFTNNSFGDRATDLGLKAGLENSYSYLYRLQRNLITYEEYFYTTRNQIYNFDYDSEGNKFYYREVIRNEYGRKVKKRIPIKNPNLGDFYFDDSRRVCINFGVQLTSFEERSRYRTDIDKDFYDREITLKEILDNPDIFHRLPVIVLDNRVLRDFSIKIYEDYFTLILTRRIKENNAIKKTYLGWDYIYQNLFDEEHQEYSYQNHKFFIQIIENVMMTNDFDMKKVYKYTNTLSTPVTTNYYIEQEVGSNIYSCFIKNTGKYLLNRNKQLETFTEDDIKKMSNVTLVNSIELGTFEIKINSSSLKIDSNRDATISLDFIRSYLKDDVCTLYKEEDGCYFASIFISDNPLSGDDSYKSAGMLLDVDVTDSGLEIHFDEPTKNLLSNRLDEITIRFNFYRYLHKHKGFRGNYIETHEYEDELELQAWSDVFMIQKEELKDYDMAIPKENLVIFKMNKEDKDSGIVNLMPNNTVHCYYSNIFQIRNRQERIIVNNNPVSNRYKYYYTSDGKCYNPYDEYVGNEDKSPEEVKKLLNSNDYISKTRYKLNSIKPGDKFRVYYFYYPSSHDLKYENMYSFFYKYLYCKWGHGSKYENKMDLDEIINFIIFNSENLEKEFVEPKGEIDVKALEDLVVFKDAVIEFLDGSLTPDYSSLPEEERDKITYDFSLTDQSEVVLDSGDNTRGELYLGDDTKFKDAEIKARIVYNFLMTFNFIVFHEIVHYHYDDIDYLLNVDNKMKPYAKDMTALEYRVKRLKEFISDDPEILRKYVLSQNKVSKKYEYYFKESENLNNKYTKTLGTPHIDIVESYLFAFERFESSSSINYRIFINGFLFVDYIHEVSGYQDYIYIPVTELKEGDYVEIETFPTYSFSKTHTFTKDEPSILIDFTSSNETNTDSLPTLSDLYIKYPYNDNIFYPKEDFIFETVCDNYNYYVDDREVPVYIPKKVNEITTGIYVERDNQTRYIPTLVSTDKDGVITTEKLYAKYISTDEITNEKILTSDLDIMIAEKRVSLRDDGQSYLVNNSNIAYKKNGVESIKIITPGFAGYITSDELSDINNLIEEPIITGRKVFRNINTGDYFMQIEVNKDAYYLYNKFDLLESDTVYTLSDINNQIVFTYYVNGEDNRFEKINFGGGFYTANGNHYSYKGEREPEKDISSVELQDAIDNELMFVDRRILCDNMLLVSQDNNYITHDKVIDGDNIINLENKCTTHTPLTKLKITVKNNDYFNNGDFTVEIGVRKDSILIYEEEEYDNYPCLDIGIRNQIIPVEKYVDPDDNSYWKKHTYYNRFYHYAPSGGQLPDPYKSIKEMEQANLERELIKGVGYTHIIEPGANEFVRVFRQKLNDGARLRSKNRYELLMNEGALDYGHPRVQMLERIMKGEKIIVDVTPYRNRLVYYQKYLADPETYDGQGILLVDLRTYINKPFDTRYYEVYINGRRISRNNIFIMSPYMIRLAGIHSLHSLEIYEKDRDWEYYGCDYKDYYLLNDLLLENFMEEGIKKELIDKIPDGPKLPENHICEDDEDYDRDLNIESVFLEIFYYNRLLPLRLANADDSYFNFDDIKYNFPIVYTLFYRYMSNIISNKYYKIETSEKFEKVKLQYTDILYDGVHTEIIKTMYANGLYIVIYKGTRGLHNFYDVYSGPDLTQLNKVFELDDEFLFETVRAKFEMLYAKNLYIITAQNKYGIYYTSSDGSTWIRRKASFKYLIDDINHDLSMSIITPSFMNEEFVFFGGCYDETGKFIDYMSIKSYDGLNYHWMPLSLIRSTHINFNLPAYYSADKQMVIFADEHYTTDGIEIGQCNLDLVSDIKKNIGISLTKPELISESCGILYAGKKSNVDENFNYTAYSKDGIIWRKLSDTFYLTSAYGINDARIAVQLIKGESNDSYKFILDDDLDTEIDFSDITKKMPEDFNSFDEFIYLDNGVYVRSGNVMYYLTIKKVYIGPANMNKIPEHILLLDPDIYYQGENEDQWNVYMTGNSDEFMEEFLKK